jgi:hypothetical protein
MTSSLFRVLVLIALTQGEAAAAVKPHHGHARKTHLAEKKTLHAEQPCVNIVNLIREKFRNTLEKSDALTDLATALELYGQAWTIGSNQKGLAETARDSAEVQTFSMLQTTKHHHHHKAEKLHVTDAGIKAKYIAAIATANSIMSRAAFGNSVTGLTLFPGNSNVATIKQKVEAITAGDPVSAAIKKEVSDELGAAKALVQEALELKLDVLDTDSELANELAEAAENDADEKDTLHGNAVKAVKTAFDADVERRKEAAEATTTAADRTKERKTAASAVQTAIDDEGRCVTEANIDGLTTLKGAAKDAKDAAVKADSDAKKEESDALEAEKLAVDAESKASDEHGEAVEEQASAEAKWAADKAAADSYRAARIEKSNKDSGDASAAAAVRATNRAAKIMNATKHYTYSDLKAMKESYDAVTGTIPR